MSSVFQDAISSLLAPINDLPDDEGDPEVTTEGSQERILEPKRHV